MIVKVLGLLFSAIVACGCTQSTGTGRSAIANLQQPQESGATKDPVQMRLFDKFPKGADAWRRLAENGKYRVAVTSDFNIPVAAMEKYGHDISRAIEFAYLGEDINHDALRHDLAFIVVDTTRADAARFGFVIFNEPKDKQAVPTPHWVYRDRDMSTMVLSWASGGLSLRTYRKDGSFDLCYVNWNTRRQEYSCDEEYDDSHLRDANSKRQKR